MAIKGSVTINFVDDQHYTLDPPLGIVDRNVQIIQWTLVAPANMKFADPGIIFTPIPLPLGFSPWPPNAVLEREDDWQYRCKVNQQVDKGDPPARYRYDIVVEVDGVTHNAKLHHPTNHDLIIDPPVENQPQP